ncbi:MAG: ABC transporter ATP-binding protein [Pseudomonadota bacterium]
MSADRNEAKQSSRRDGLLLEVKGVSKRFGSLQAVSDCSFDVERGKIVGLIGPNGAGKSTVFELITGFQRLDSGTVLFRGENISGDAPYLIARKGIGRTFQTTRVFPKLTVLENLRLASRSPDWEAEALALLQLSRLVAVKDDYAGSLSFGQQKLVSLMQIVILGAELILLDEPSAGINPTLQRDIVDLIRQLNASGKTFLVIEHNMDFVMKHCEKVVVLAAGTRIAKGPALRSAETRRC